MNIEIKKSIKPINYFDAINILEKRLDDLYAHINKELIWTLEHDEIFTAVAQRFKGTAVQISCHLANRK